MTKEVLIPMTLEHVSEMDTTLNQYIEKCDDGNVKCTVCGKMETSRNKVQNLKKHIETHLEGLSFPCQFCGKTFRYRLVIEISRIFLC